MSDSQQPIDIDSAPVFADQAEGQNVDATLSEKVQTLTWALIDEHINENEQGELEQLLKTDAEARATYVECVQMHVELQSYFSESSKSDPTKQPGTATMPPLDLPTLPSGNSTPADG